MRTALHPFVQTQTSMLERWREQGREDAGHGSPPRFTIEELQGVDGDIALSVRAYLEGYDELEPVEGL